MSSSHLPFILGSLIFLPALPAGAVTTTDIPGPARSGAFGTAAVILPNGNFVVTDPLYDVSSTVTDAGAVSLYDGATLQVISVLTGSVSGDRVGGGDPPVTVLTNGNYIVHSPDWHNGAAAGAGAVTWCSGTAGLAGAVSVENSLVGGSAGDAVGSGRITVLPNGHYVVASPDWNNPAAGKEGAYAGAVTWGNGTTGVKGLVTPENSLTGALLYDRVGNGGITILKNGNYLVGSYNWTNPDPDAGKKSVGALTWANGATGITGMVSAANSLIGGTEDDRIGQGRILTLANGNYVVSSTSWHNGPLEDAGAVTWGNGTTGVTGRISAANSLVGNSTRDYAGFSVKELANGNYVVSTPYWYNGGASPLGAVTWGSGTTGVSGEISSANSLTGSTPGDSVGSYGVTALSNGNYTVNSPEWNHGAGAVTWGNGTTGITGPVSPANSLTGGSPEDHVGGESSFPLTNGNYVVTSPGWDNGAAADAGAATWGSGTAGVSGMVSAVNSLVGTRAGDRVGSAHITRLSGGHYVVNSPEWSSATAVKAGAVTWVNSASGVTGAVSLENSLTGGTAGDRVGSGSCIALRDGGYAAASPQWSHGGLAKAGALTVVRAAAHPSGLTGLVSPANSLVGGSAGDQVGDTSNFRIPLVELSNGNWLVLSPNWSSGTAAGAGAVTWLSGTGSLTGVISAANSLTGSSAGDHVGASKPYPLRDATGLLNGNHVVGSPDWSNGRGAATWINGATGLTGTVSAANSLTGSAANDHVGADFGLFILPSGDYLALSPEWNSGSIVDAGAVTFGDGAAGISGAVTTANSFTGTKANAGALLNYTASGSLVVLSNPQANRIRVHRIAAVTGIAAWRAASFGTATVNTGNLEDFDGDGVMNLLEFAFGTSPVSGSSGPGALQYTGPLTGGGSITAAGQPALLPDGGGFAALFIRRKDSAQAGLTWTPQLSGNLTDWQDLTGEIKILAEDDTRQIVSLPVPAPAAESKAGGFFRVRVSLAP